MAADGQIAVAVSSPCVRVSGNGQGVCPSPVVGRISFVPICLTDGDGKDVKCAVIAELLHHLIDRRCIQPVIPVVVTDGSFNRFLAGCVCLIGCAAGSKLVMLSGVGCRVLIKRQIVIGRWESTAAFLLSHRMTIEATLAMGNGSSKKK